MAQQKQARCDSQNQNAFKFLDRSQIAMIDEALHSLGDFGEVRLTVRKGRLRFLVTQRSFDALKWEPGNLSFEYPPIE